MNRRFLVIAAFAIWAQCSAVFAQVEMPASFEPGDKIAATVTGAPPAGAVAEYSWSIDGVKPESTEVADGGRRWLGWPAPRPEPYLLTLEAVYTFSTFIADPAFPDDPTKAKPTKITMPPYRYVHQFTVNGAGPPPVIPPLAVLAGPDAQKLGTLYDGLAKQSASITSAASFKAVHAKLLADQGLASNGAAAVIEKRLAPAMEPYSAAKLKSVLEEFVAELGSLPPPPGPDSPATAATYIYEKDNTAIPVGVSTGLNRLNREKNIRATLFEEDTVDGDGDVPDQYKVPLEAATKAGLPALVVTAGDAVLKVVKDPRTEQQVMEAIAL